MLPTRRPNPVTATIIRRHEGKPTTPAEILNKGLAKPWQSWDTVVAQCQRVSVLMAEAVASRRAGWTDVRVAR